jgi:hypothetical protein
VVTRWGTWIETASYYFANYEIVKKFIKTKLKATSKAAQTLIDLVDNQKLEDEIFYANDFAFLPKILPSTLMKITMKLLFFVMIFQN